MTKKQPPLATFRCDEQLWQDFKDLCSKNNTNASAALIAFVKQSVASGNLDINAQAYRQITPTQSILLNLDDIYKYIDNRLDNIDAQSRRDTDTQISTQNLEELIDSRILLSVLNGDIKEANARSYSQATTNLNSTRKEFYSKVEELEKQLEELKSNPPVAVAVPLIPQSPITSEELPETTSPAVVLNHQSPEDRRYSKIVDWVCAQLNLGRLISDHFGSIDPITNQPCGELFDNEYLIEHNFHGQIAARKDELELRLGIILTGSKARVTSDVKAILTALGFQFGHKQIKKKETYWVINPQNEKNL